MRITRILIALDLRSYHEFIAATFRDLRPDVQVFDAAPNNLDHEVLRLKPDLVVCSRATPLVKSRVQHRVELYPDHGSRSMVCVEGDCSEVENIQLVDLISVIDRVELTAS